MDSWKFCKRIINNPRVIKMIDPVVIVLIILISIIFLHSWANSLPSTNEKLILIKKKLIQVDPRAEHVKFFTHPTEAFILGKKEIYMCVNEPSGKYYSDNTLMYIALHELAHALIPYDTSHHPPEFDKLFNQLKDRASYLKLYDPSIPFPDEYCGNKLSYY